MEVIGDPQAVEPGLLRQARLADYFAGIVLFSVLIPGADCTTVFCAILDPAAAQCVTAAPGPSRHCRRNRTARSANSTTPCPLRWPSPPIRSDLTPERVAGHLSARLLSGKHTGDVALLVHRQPHATVTAPGPCTGPIGLIPATMTEDA